jgi:hypothetical protein
MHASTLKMVRRAISVGEKQEEELGRQKNE